MAKKVLAWVAAAVALLTVLAYLAAYAAVTSSIEVKEYATQFDALHRETRRFGKVPPILPLGALEIRQVLNHDDNYQWVRFKLPREQWSGLTASLIEVPGNSAIHYLPVVPKIIRQGWPRALRRGSREAADSLSKYMFYSTVVPDVMVAMERGSGDDAWVFMWTLTVLDR